MAICYVFESRNEKMNKFFGDSYCLVFYRSLKKTDKENTALFIFWVRKNASTMGNDSHFIH